MICFSHKQQHITLNPSGHWAERSDAVTYRDTSKELLWEIVREVESGTPWREAVRRRYAESYPWLNAIVTSTKRDLFFRQHPPAAGDRVLDIGSGWGQMALPLAKTAFVAALEPTPERMAFIRATAAQEKLLDQMCFVESDFFSVDFETRFNLICCVGVLEWTASFRPGDPKTIHAGFLSRCAGALAQGGKFVLGIENRLGLKYLLGANDDHIGMAGISVYDATLADKKMRHAHGLELRAYTFTQKELSTMLQSAGFKHTRFYCAFPDYKLPDVITEWGTTTDTACMNGAPALEHDGVTGAPLTIMEELNSHYRSLAEMGISSAFAPSFYVEAGI